MHLVVIAENRLSAGFEIGEFEPRRGRLLRAALIY
jgi:hypothetical protein